MLVTIQLLSQEPSEDPFRLSLLWGWLIGFDSVSADDEVGQAASTPHEMKCVSVYCE